MAIWVTAFERGGSISHFAMLVYLTASYPLNFLTIALCGHTLERSVAIGVHLLQRFRSTLISFSTGLHEYRCVGSSSSFRLRSICIARCASRELDRLPLWFALELRLNVAVSRRERLLYVDGGIGCAMV